MEHRPLISGLPHGSPAISHDALSATRPPVPWLLRPVTVGIVVFVALLIVKFDTLSEPPAWDAAMSVHPAAITLAETGFDYGALLASPGIDEGGPNTHTLSIYTAVAAIAYAAFEPPTALLFLHLLSFVFGGLTAVALVRIGRQFLPAGSAAVVAVASMAIPVVLTQFGMLYLDAPVLMATSWALVAAVERRWVAASVLSLLATSIKPSGVITAAAIAWFYLRQRAPLGRVTAILVPASVVFWLQTAANPRNIEPSLAVGSAVARESWQFLVLVPDLLVLMILAIIAGALLDRKDATEASSDIGGLSSSFLLSFVGFYGLSMTFAFTTLPRYYIQIVPLALLTILVWVSVRYGSKAFHLAAAAMFLFSVINFNGVAYPYRSSNNFALLERSDAYDQQLALEVAVSEAICELSTQGAFWFSEPEAFRLRYPQMGYASCAPEGRSVVWASEIELTDLPETLFVTFEYRRFGGAILDRLVAEADASAEWNVEVARIVKVGDFQQDIYHLSRLP